MRFLLFLAVLFCGQVRSEDMSFQELSAYVKSNPTDLKAVYSLAVRLYREKEFQASLKYWKYLAKQRPDDARIRYSWAKTLYEAEEVDEALVQCHRLLGTEEKSRCQEMFQTAEKDFPDAYRFYEARKAFAEKNYEEASGILDELLGLDVLNPKYRLLKGHLYRMAKDYARAWDHYDFAQSKMEQDEAMPKIRDGLVDIGKACFEYVNKTKGAIEDERQFYDRFFFALRLYEEETNQRLRGFRQKAVDHFRSRLEEGDSDPYEMWYRIGSIQAASGDAGRASEAFENAMNEAPDDVSYASLEFLMEKSKNRKSKQQSVEDLIEMAGGEDVYAAILKASEEADRMRQEAIARGEDVASLPEAKQAIAGIDKAQFVAEFENYKRRYQAASSEGEKTQLKAEIEGKYGHLLKDPAAKSQFQSFLGSSEGKALQQKYGSQIDQYKDKIPNLR